MRFNLEIPEDNGPLSALELDEYIREKLDQITRKIVLDLFTFLIAWTPVDTGRARAGWAIGKGRPPTRVPPEGEDYYEDPRPPRSVFVASTLMVWFITNNVEYIEVLDEGRGYRDGQVRGSEQAPNGMTSAALSELERSI